CFFPLPLGDDTHLSLLQINTKSATVSALISNRFFPSPPTSIHSAARNSPRLLSAEPASSSLYLPIGVCAFLCTAKLSRLHLRLRQNSTSAIGLLISSFCTIEPTSSPSAAFGFHRLLCTIGSPYPFSAHLTSTTTAALRALARKHLELPKFFVYASAVAALHPQLI
ncbi:hypothetical protein B296_00033090, partial [Ensete ventricosum]